MKSADDGYRKGEMERIALATANSNLRSDLLAAQQEIELLRAALALAVGEMSSSGEYSYLSFDQLMQHFMEEARRD